MTLNFIPRPSQEQILRYRGGRLGIAAVPGAGKTQILSALAAQIIANGSLGDEQEVLIVTLVNSAVDNFANRIRGMVEQSGLIPHLGYRVRTLHGLAHDIVREKPALAGLDERFQIVDEREAEFIRKEAANAWLASHSFDLDDYLDPGMDDNKRDWVRRQQLPDLSPEGRLLPFKVHVAPMGSGSQVVEDEKVWSFISESMRKTLGLEMEAAALGALAAFATDPRARERLETAARSKDPAVRQVAQQALKGRP